ncbi:MAG: thioredoxin family protein [Acidimicrobiales bacterium]
MVATPSTMLPLGTTAPEFALPDPSGTEHTLDSVATGHQGLLVAFICNHCPYVQHIRRELALLTEKWQRRGIAVVGINPNDADAYPDDSPEAMAAEARTVGYTFPYLVDADQDVARAYRAACTPDFFLFDADRKLVYRGQLDGSRPKNDVPVTGADLSAAIDALLDGRPITDDQYPSMGCNIKWKADAEPTS